jgi:hypothetical protein
MSYDDIPMGLRQESTRKATLRLDEGDENDASMIKAFQLAGLDWRDPYNWRHLLSLFSDAHFGAVATKRTTWDTFALCEALKDYYDVKRGDSKLTELDICKILRTAKQYRKKYERYNIHSLRKIVRNARDPTKNTLLRHLEIRNAPLQLIREHFESQGIDWNGAVPEWGSVMAEMWEHLNKCDGDVPVQRVIKPSDNLTENITMEAMREFIRRSGEFVLELDTRKWKFSSKAKLLLGLDKNEGERLSSWKRVVPHHVSKIRAAIDEAANTGQFKVTFLVDHTYDTLNWISGDGKLSEDRRTISGTFLDFTDMHLAKVEANLERAELEERALMADLRSVGWRYFMFHYHSRAGEPRA